MVTRERKIAMLNEMLVNLVEHTKKYPTFTMPSWTAEIIIDQLDEIEMKDILKHQEVSENMRTPF